MEAFPIALLQLAAINRAILTPRSGRATTASRILVGRVIVPHNTRIKSGTKDIGCPHIALHHFAVSSGKEKLGDIGAGRIGRDTGPIDTLHLQSGKAIDTLVVGQTRQKRGIAGLLSDSAGLHDAVLLRRRSGVVQGEAAVLI